MGHEPLNGFASYLKGQSAKVFQSLFGTFFLGPLMVYGKKVIVIIAIF